MENVLKNTTLNICIFILINIICLDYYLPLMLCFHFIEKSNQIFFYVIFVTVNRFYLLYFYYKFLMNHTKNQEIKFFMHDFKASLSKKILLLFITFIFSPVFGVIVDVFLNNNYDIKSLIATFELGLMFAPFISLYQAYLILYIYWFIEDVKTKTKNI